MTTARNKRLDALEIGGRAKERLPMVWVRPGQSRADALAEAGLPPDAPNEFFTWREPQ